MADQAQDLIVRWRTGHLREAGFDAQLAETLAADCVYDLHAVRGSMIMAPRLEELIVLTASALTTVALVVRVAAIEAGGP